jgi:transposase
MEIITGVERRRRWRTEDKLRIVAEAERPGACFAEVARRHEVSRGLLWQWRDQVRRGVLVAEAAPVFVPVRVTADPPPPVPGANAAPAASSAPGKTKCSTGDGRIEIALPDGTLIRVGEEIGSAALRRVVAALRGA